MHIAFRISDVFNGILDYLVDDIDLRSLSSPPRKALMALAMTCRAFSEPALDALWRRLNGLYPFISCIPTRKPYETQDMLLPTFDEEEWRAILRYAPRIQELTIESHWSMDILQCLSFRTLQLLPNLRKLHWACNFETFPMIRLLLGPSLVHLHMQLRDGDRTSILAFLESCHILSPNIKSLHFDHTGRFPHVTTTISRVISRFPDLEALSCGHIDEAVLIRVAGSRCLKRLSCDLLRYHLDDLRRIAGYSIPDHPPFMNLRFLELRAKTLSSVIPYLTSQHQPFEEVSVEISEVLPPEVFHEFFDALCSPTRRGTLRRVAISTAPIYEGECSTQVTPQPIDVETLSPLSDFHLLALDIHIENPISLNIDQLLWLVQGWPQLECLRLIGNQLGEWRFLPPCQHLTLSGLVRLLARCPKLHDLGLSIDARRIPRLSDNEPLIRNTAITTLSVVNSPIRGPITNVARFLLRHLPSLTKIEVHPYLRSPGQPGWRWKWEKVSKEIQRAGKRCSGTEWGDDEPATDSDSS